MIMRVTLAVLTAIWLYLTWTHYQEGHRGLMVGSVVAALVCLAGAIL